ncbi:MAG: molybdopterin-dependent oxidoreductase [Proteobacteria bacterium]|nr:molybdopterin-dependent oxidoreductase [Pseudomonadota bacterium]
MSGKTRQVKRTFCQICKCDCGILAEVKGGKILGIEGDQGNPNSRGKLCVKGRNSLETLYHRDRLQRPLLNTGQRGHPTWKEISWDTALEVMGDRLDNLKGGYGAESLVLLFGTTSRILDTAIVKRFANLYGTPNVTQTWSICIGPKAIANLATFGGPEYPTCDFANSNFIMLWGANPLVSYMHRYHGIVEDILKGRRRNGAPLIVVDPRDSETARIADVHLRIKPNSDFYLAMGMIRHLIDNDLHDHDFVQRYTVGFNELRRTLGGYDLETVSQKTDLPIHMIRQITEKLAESKPASIDRREGVLHTVNGLQTARAIAILMTLTGNVDVEGGLVFNPLMEVNDITLQEMRPHDKTAFWSERYPLALDCSGYLTEVILTEKPYPVKSIIAMESNPLLTLPDTNRFRTALEKLEFVAVHDLFLTETCRFADLVLPATTFYEKAELDVGLLKGQRWVRIRRKVVEPLHDSKSEAEFMVQLGKKMGYGTYFDFPSEDKILESLLKETEAEGYSLDQLERGVHLEAMKPGYLKEWGFDTPSGKIELASSTLRPFGAELPAPIEGPIQSQDYPFLLITGAKVPPYYHSQFRNIRKLKKRSPTPLADLGVGVARKVGISDGDIITIETPSGTLEIEGTIHERMHPFTVSIPHGWAGCNANILTSDRLLEPISGVPMYRGIPCRITKGVSGS